METVKNIAAILGLVLTTFSVITLCSEKTKAMFANLFGKYNKTQDEAIEQLKESVNSLLEKINTLIASDEVLMEFTRQQCRDIIKDIFYKYITCKKLPVHERKRLDYIEDIYINRLNGNSYASELLDEMKQWEVDYLVLRSED